MPGIFDEFPRYITQPFSVLPSSQEKKEIVGYFSFPDDFSGFQGISPAIRYCRELCKSHWPVLPQLRVAVI